MAHVQFSETVYTVSETNAVRVCVEVTPGGCDINFPFDISFTTIDGSASKI